MCVIVLSGAVSLCAGNMTLSQALLNSLPNSEVDFSQATIGSGPLAVTNTLGPGDTVFIQAHTRKRISLKNLTQGTVANPIIVTNTGGQFIIDIATQLDLEGRGIALLGCQNVILRGTPSPGVYDYGIKVNRTRLIPPQGTTPGFGSSGITVNSNGAGVGSVGIEISHIEICNTGFAGIMAKCDGLVAPFVMDGIRIHHNYIHETEGEGLYIGWTSGAASNHDMANVDIHDNLIVNAGWDGIGLNRCTVNAKVHHNTILGYGVKSHTAENPPNNYSYWQNEGITGARNDIAIYNNWVQATGDGAGTGIFQYPYTSLRIYNNVLIHTGVSSASATASYEAGIYLINNANGPVQPGAIVKVMNNTIITPEGAGMHKNSTIPLYYYNNIVAGPRNGSPYTVGTLNFSGTNLHVATVAAAGFTNAANHDYSLTPASSAVNAGTDVSADGVTTDFFDVARPQGASYDIGALEHIPWTILTPSAWGQAVGSATCPATGTFNEQPTWNAGTQQPNGVSGTPHSTTNTNYVSRHWYIDFGTNWANKRITGMWTRYRPYSPGNFGGFAGFWWDNDNDNVNDGINAPTLNFQTAQGVGNVGTQLWIQDRNFTSAPVAPQGRYLLVLTPATVTDRPNEFAFVGYTIP